MPGENWQKNQTNAKQHRKAELLLFENYSHSLFEHKSTFSKNEQKNKCALFMRLYNQS